MKCRDCPLYEQQTSYGREFVKCNNMKCPYYYPYFPDYGICRKSNETSVSKER